MPDHETDTSVSMLMGRLSQADAERSRGPGGKTGFSGKSGGSSAPYLYQWIAAEMEKVAEAVKNGGAMDQARLDELTMTLLVTQLSQEVRATTPDRFAIQDLTKTLGAFRASKKGVGKTGEDALAAREADAFAARLGELKTTSEGR